MGLLKRNATDKQLAIEAAKETLLLKKEIAILKKRMEGQSKIFSDYCRKNGLIEHDEFKIVARKTKNIVGGILGMDKEDFDEAVIELIENLDEKYVENTTSVKLRKKEFIKAVGKDEALQDLLSKFGLAVEESTSYSVKSIV